MVSVEWLIGALRPSTAGMASLLRRWRRLRRQRADSSAVGPPDVVGATVVLCGRSATDGDGDRQENASEYGDHAAVLHPSPSCLIADTFHDAPSRTRAAVTSVR